LVGVLLLAPEVMGARRWFDFGPIKIQPAEMAKIALILMLARLLSGFRPARWRVLPAITALALIGVPALLVLREPDLGTALVFPAIWLGMVFWQGTSWVFLLAVAAPVISAVISFYSEAVVEQAWPWGLYLLLLIGVLYLGRFRFVESLVLLLGNIATGLGIPLIWTWLKPYQQERILSFFDPARDVQGAGYQVFQSKVAIGAGGFFGTHYLQGTQKGLAFLPERHTDFIFSVIGEELGFVGAVALLGLFLVLILRGVAIAHAARRAFASFVAIGCVCVLAFHVIVNVSITTGLLPVTGLPLPLISYGGSNVLTTSVLLGLLVNIDARAYES
jgi:rod shape determining protein RodA